MHRFLERFSAFASTAVVFVYLGGLFLGTSAYFVGQAFNLNGDWTFSVGVALALAVEIHSFLSQRLTRAHWQALHKLDSATAEYEAASVQFRTHLGITAALVGFSMFNSVAFWALILHPRDAGEWVAVVVRGAAVPGFFLAAGFLTPLTHDASAMLASAASAMLNKTMKTTLKQWQRRLNDARNRHIDLAPVAIALMEDANEHAAARRLRIIADALAEAEGLPTVRTEHLPLPAPSVPNALSGPLAPLDAQMALAGYPTSTNAHSSPSAAQASRESGQVVSFAQRSGGKRRASPRAKQKQTLKARQVRTGASGYASYEHEAEAAYLQGANTVDKMIAATGAARSTAAKWVRTLDERHGKAALEAQEA